METLDYIALLWCGSGARLSKVLEIKNFNNTETVSGTLTNTFGLFLADSFFVSFPKPLKPPSGMKTEQYNGPLRACILTGTFEKCSPVTVTL